VQHRHTDIQQDGLRPEAGGHFEGFQTIVGRTDLGTHELQQDSHTFRGIAIVVDHKDTVGGTKSSSPLMGSRLPVVGRAVAMVDHA
jgi:hypothetical protein